MQESEGRALLWSAGLVDQDRELAKLDEHLVQWQPGCASCHDGRFEYGMLGAVEPEKLAESSLGDGLDDDRCPLVSVVELDDAELAVSASAQQDPAGDDVCLP